MVTRLHLHFAILLLYVWLAGQPYKWPLPIWSHHDRCSKRVYCREMATQTSHSKKHINVKSSLPESLVLTSEGESDRGSTVSEDADSSLCLQDDKRRISSKKLVALDCEMVGVGAKKESALARCSVVDYYGRVLFDAYVKPSEIITDYRTRYSGIQSHHMKNAISFKKAKLKVRRLIKRKLLIGHALNMDLNILTIRHPKNMVRDTSKFPSLRLLAGLPINGTPSLRNLTEGIFNRSIQVKTHCSVEDARAAMALYKEVEDEWECRTESSTVDTKKYLHDAFWPDWACL